jgi:hypothetical protein
MVPSSSEFSQQELCFGSTTAVFLALLMSVLALALPVAFFGMETLSLRSMAEVVRGCMERVDVKQLAAQTNAFDKRPARTMARTRGDVRIASCLIQKSWPRKVEPKGQARLNIVHLSGPRVKRYCKPQKRFTGHTQDQSDPTFMIKHFETLLTLVGSLSSPMTIGSSRRSCGEIKRIRKGQQYRRLAERRFRSLYWENGK